jgi:hypothetical protein
MTGVCAIATDESRNMKQAVSITPLALSIKYSSFFKTAV